MNRIQEEEHVFNTGAARSKVDNVRLDLVSPISNLFKAQRYALGAVKRGEHNWRKGMPYSAIVNHMLLHLHLYMIGDRSDDHLAAVEWGAAAMQEQDFTCPEMNDLYKYPPHVLERVKQELVSRWERDFPPARPATPLRPRNKPRAETHRTKR